MGEPHSSLIGALEEERFGCIMSETHRYTDVWGEVADYKDLFRKRNEVLTASLNSPHRFQSIYDREDRSDIPLEAIKAHTLGKYFIQHRGCQLIKTADDQAILKELLYYLRPSTIIELGTGGNAIWMADMLRLMEIECKIFSMDIDPTLIEPRVKKLKPSNVTFIKGDSYKIEESFPLSFLQELPHPWLIIEDAHENVSNILEYFQQYMKTGDYFIVEDTSPLLSTHCGVGRIYKDRPYKEAGSALLEKVKSFLKKNDSSFKVDSFFTDFFGYNGTWNWHGFIRKM